MALDSRAKYKTNVSSFVMNTVCDTQTELVGYRNWADARLTKIQEIDENFAALLERVNEETSSIEFNGAEDFQNIKARLNESFLVDAEGVIHQLSLTASELRLYEATEYRTLALPDPLDSTKFDFTEDGLDILQSFNEVREDLTTTQEEYVGFIHDICLAAQSGPDAIQNVIQHGTNNAVTSIKQMALDLSTDTPEQIIPSCKSYIAQMTNGFTTMGSTESSDASQNWKFSVDEYTPASTVSSLTGLWSFLEGAAGLISSVLLIAGQTAIAGALLATQGVFKLMNSGLDTLQEQTLPTYGDGSSMLYRNGLVFNIDLSQADSKTRASVMKGVPGSVLSTPWGNFYFENPNQSDAYDGTSVEVNNIRVLLYPNATAPFGGFSPYVKDPTLITNGLWVDQNRWMYTTSLEVESRILNQEIYQPFYIPSVSEDITGSMDSKWALSWEPCLHVCMNLSAMIHFLSAQIIRFTAADPQDRYIWVNCDPVQRTTLMSRFGWNPSPLDPYPRAQSFYTLIGALIAGISPSMRFIGTEQYSVFYSYVIDLIINNTNHWSDLNAWMNKKHGIKLVSSDQTSHPQILQDDGDGSGVGQIVTVILDTFANAYVNKAQNSHHVQISNYWSDGEFSVGLANFLTNVMTKAHDSKPWAPMYSQSLLYPVPSGSYDPILVYDPRVVLDGYPKLPSKFWIEPPLLTPTTAMKSLLLGLAVTVTAVVGTIVIRKAIRKHQFGKAQKQEAKTQAAYDEYKKNPTKENLNRAYKQSRKYSRIAARTGYSSNTVGTYSNFTPESRDSVSDKLLGTFGDLGGQAAANETADIRQLICGQL